MAGFDLICCVVKMGDASKTIKCAKKYGVKGGTINIGRGTVGSHFLGMLGITEVRKEIVTMIVEDELASEAIRGISHDMDFDKPHHGIAFSYSVKEFIGSRNKLVSDAKITNGGKTGMSDESYSIIYVVVDKGKAEDVVEAAKIAGARGGTIFNARGSGIHETQKLFSIAIEPEKEVVFILTKTEIKDAVVESIRSKMGLDEPGRGILFVLEVNEVHGLYTE